MFFRGASSGWLLRLWLSFAFVLLSAENCSTPNRNIGGVNTGDPTEGKFVLGRAINGTGGTYTSSDGRPFTYSLVQSKDAAGNLVYYVTDDEFGERSATSINVAPPNELFRFTYTINEQPTNVVVLTTPSYQLPFESAKYNLAGSGLFIRHHVKASGNGLGSVLLSSGIGDDEDLKLLNVTLNGGGEVQSPLLRAQKFLVNGQTRYITLSEKNRSCYFMHLTSASVGEFGVIDPNGTESSLSGQLYTND